MFFYIVLGWVEGLGDRSKAAGPNGNEFVPWLGGGDMRNERVSRLGGVAGGRFNKTNKHFSACCALLPSS